MQSPRSILLAAALLLTAPFSLAAQDQPLTPEQAQAVLAAEAEAARIAVAGLSFDEWEATVPRIEETRVYIVSGDVPIPNRKQLREFWLANVKNRPAGASEGDVTEFAVKTVGGLDAIWNATDRHALSYCVSTTFGTDQARVAAAMIEATAAWEAAADLDFQYHPEEDGKCDNTNNRVMFDVVPRPQKDDFFALAFFPNDLRQQRSVMIFPNALRLLPNQPITLTGILRHELGHVIGARHEHIRPEAGGCTGEAEEGWRGVTDYDAMSVMHYPQCTDIGNWTLQLTDRDRNGVACLYGPAPGFSPDPAVCIRHGSTRKTISFGPERLAANAKKAFDEVSVVPGSRFLAVLRPEGPNPGDADLYVKFDGLALIGRYDCRPFNEGSDETCSLDVPPDRGRASVMVNAFSDATYRLDLTYTEPAP